MVPGSRVEGSNLEKDSLLGTSEGTRAHGRQRIMFMDGTKTLLGCNGIVEVIQLAQNGQKWRNIVANVNIVTARR